MFTKEEYFESWLLPLLIRRNELRRLEEYEKENKAKEETSKALSKFKRLKTSPP
jgi:hypothetical protein